MSYEVVVGLDLSLTAPGIARILSACGAEPAHAVATTLDRVPTDEKDRGLVLHEAAERVAIRASNLAAMVGGERLAVMEALLLQSTNGKAMERAAFWWMVRAQLETRGFLVVSVHPTSRRSIAMDATARAEWRDAPKAKKSLAGKRAVLASVRRRWPGVVLPDDNAADALVCAEVGAHALGFAGLPSLAGAQLKSLRSAIGALGITERKADQ